MPKLQMLRRNQVEAQTGLSKSSLYRRMAEGRFPQPVRVGPQSVRWRTAEIEAWLAGLPVGVDSTASPRNREGCRAAA